jgi:hypothetical protein
MIDHSQYGEFPLFITHARPKRGGVVVDVAARDVGQNL